MNNKKLLKFILKDLSELEELIAEKGSNNFDELEWEFLQTRVGGAKRMVNILFDRENTPETEKVVATSESSEIKKEVSQVQQKSPEVQVAKENLEPSVEKVALEEVEVIEKTDEKIQTKDTSPEIEKKIETPIEAVEIKAKKVDEKEVELEDEETAAEIKQTLGDSFSKEKSVNDIIDFDKKNLEQKLSNRPVTDIKSAIGINDRFQFIRELFDGNADTFSKAVTEIDSKKDIKEAVEYLQQNFKWKKNETSLKFVNLVKRRFANE